MSHNAPVQDAVVIQRSFEAPRALVWTMWTDPKHFAEWYGPAGITEIGVVADGRLLAAVQRRVGLRDYERNPLGAIREWADLPDALLAAVPVGDRRRLRSDPVTLLGGATRTDGLPDRLSALWGRDVASVKVRHPVVEGLVAVAHHSAA